MAEWLIEEGIGEHRALLIDEGQVIAARIDWPGSAGIGLIEDAILTSRTKASTRGTARLATGEEVLVSKLSAAAQEGGPIRIEITRSQMGEKSRVKRAQGRPTVQALQPPLSLAEAIVTRGEKAKVVRKLPVGHWDEIWDDAWTGICDFAGGSLHFSPAPAMVLVDIDGRGSPRELALAATEPIAKAIRRFDLGGSIGIDFPTLAVKADRKAVDEALTAALGDWPHEKTAMNGFGFVQIVARLERPSLLHRLTYSKADAAARRLLRRAEETTDAGAIQLICHPTIQAKLSKEWLAELSKRTGRKIRIEADPTLALEAGFAQAVPL
ncbi:ribonuclease [Pontixanthobacter aestiaquae]|uniref:Ribonuclease n=1 Tax=Pontixanthobacter aestiaquae TaxID=1509367 RepID=A0A844Z346_9SPHN|nr:ribonuclease [Pontixanthobacter aestiaquae]MDN3645885.1 ribonuclease [Pontixanthobacter aestiaquae]MXO83121.1 ribonuclease [Pontixanthobacter aestiaquae]